MFRLSKKNLLTNEYYTLINNLPRLSQEEIVDLYDSENIPYTELDLEIKELEDELGKNLLCEELGEKLDKLKKKKRGSIADRYFLTVLGRKHNIRKYPSLELRNKIVEGTMYLVIINAGIVNKLENNKLTFDELVQYGMEALISAAHYYVPGGNAKFETYASKCIRNKMLRMMSDSKRMKKRNGRAKDFFERERLKIKEIELLLKVEKTKPQYGKGYMPSTEEHLIVHRLNKQILQYNKSKDKRMENNLKLRKVYGKTLDEILERYRELFRSSKLNSLISDEDRRDIEGYLAYKNYSGVELSYFRSQYYLELYKYKLDLLEKYIKAENELLKRGEEARLEDVFGIINGEIKKTNKKISELKKNDFFDKFEKGEFSYRTLRSFYEEYLEIFDVNLFGNDEYDDNTRLFEKECIISEYEDICEECDDYIDELSQIGTEKVYVYLDKDEQIVQVEPYIPFADLSDWERKNYSDEDEYYFNQAFGEFEKFYRISREKLIEQLTRKLDELGSEDDYVKKVLKERATIVNESLAEKNRPIIEENMRIKELEDLYNLGRKYHKYLKERDFRNLQENINLLYDDDSELVDLLLEKDKSRNRRLTVEEEVFNNLFLEDYYEALKDLDDLQREILELYYDENGCSPLILSEVADILGISISKVKTEKAKALKKLRKNEKLLSYYNEDY